MPRPNSVTSYSPYCGVTKLTFILAAGRRKRKVSRVRAMPWDRSHDSQSRDNHLPPELGPREALYSHDHFICKLIIFVANLDHL